MANVSTTLFQSLTTSSVDAFSNPLTYPHVSDKAHGCGYYNSPDPMHTITYSTTGLFNGMIRIQGTLVIEPQEYDWYYIDSTMLGNGVSSVPNQTLIINFGGKHVWVRAVLESFTQGAINSVLYQHN